MAKVTRCIGVESFEVRKLHLLASYFGLSSTEELKNDLMNYQHTSTLLKGQSHELRMRDHLPLGGPSEHSRSNLQPLLVWIRR